MKNILLFILLFGVFFLSAYGLDKQLNTNDTNQKNISHNYGYGYDVFPEIKDKSIINFVSANKRYVIINKSFTDNRDIAYDMFLGSPIFGKSQYNLESNIQDQYNTTLYKTESNIDFVKKEIDVTGDVILKYVCDEDKIDIYLLNKKTNKDLFIKTIIGTKCDLEGFFQYPDIQGFFFIYKKDGKLMLSVLGQNYINQQISLLSYKAKPINNDLSTKKTGDQNNSSFKYCDETESTRAWARKQSDSQFKILNKYYAKDSDTVYRCNSFEGLTTKEVKGADAPTFKVIYKYYAKDKNHIYEKYRISEGMDPQTFQIIKKYNITIRSKDKNHVYFYDNSDGTVTVYGVDIPTFKILNSNYAKDKNHVYCGHKIVKGADLSTFYTKRENSTYAYDKNNVYSYGEILTGENPKTFQER